MDADQQPSGSLRTMQCLEVWGGNGASDNGVTMPGIDAWAFSRPYQGHAAGGDIHYVSSCGTGRISRVMVADVSGHGVDVAASAGRLRTLMRRYVNYVDQGALVGAMNREFAALEQAGRFATAVVATFWAPTGYLALSNAGHPRPLVYSAKRREWRVADTRASGQPRPQEMANLPLGVVDESRYEQFAVRMRPGDLMVIYTDSLVEAKGSDGEQIGEFGLLEVARGLDPSDGAALARGMFDAVVAACGGRMPDDDATAVVLRCNGVQPHQTLGERLATQVRFVGMVVRSLLPGGTPAPWPEARLENLLGPVVPRLNRNVGRDAKEIGE